jgi:hypothetical protein
MREIYVILGWIGWVWLPCAVLFAVGYWKGERDLRRRMLVEGEAGTAAAEPDQNLGPTDGVSAKR